MLKLLLKFRQRPITEFQGRCRFLSNFWPCTVELDGVEYPSVEHAYQAAKTTSPGIREMIRKAETPGRAKRMSRRHITLDEKAWENRKEGIMLALLRQKFKKEGMRSQLLETGEAPLIEGNGWGDTYWGVCDGQGQNRLGHLLMQVRGELRRGLL